METRRFADMAAEFQARVAAAVYCSMATVDRRGRPRSRILHPIWDLELSSEEGPTGWAISYPASHKTRHLNANPHVSLAYIKDFEHPVYADCTAGWVDDPAVKHAVWDLYKRTPPPLGFDPAPYYSSIDDIYFGLLRFTPWRIELAILYGEPQIWRKE
jgi:general stress protein 26